MPQGINNTFRFVAIFQPFKIPEAAMEKPKNREFKEIVQNPPEEPKRWMKNLGGKRNKDQQGNGYFIFKKEQFPKITVILLVKWKSLIIMS